MENYKNYKQRQAKSRQFLENYLIDNFNYIPEDFASFLRKSDAFCNFGFMSVSLITDFVFNYYYYEQYLFNLRSNILKTRQKLQ